MLFRALSTPAPAIIMHRLASCVSAYPDFGFYNVTFGFYACTCSACVSVGFIATLFHFVPSADEGFNENVIVRNDSVAINETVLKIL